MGTGGNKYSQANTVDEVLVMQFCDYGGNGAQHIGRLRICNG
jgi:hypothetical protein